MKKTTHTKQEHTHVKNLKRQLMTKDFLWRLKLHDINLRMQLHCLLAVVVSDVSDVKVVSS